MEVYPDTGLCRKGWFSEPLVRCEVISDCFQYWYEVLLGGSSLLKVPSTNTNTYKDVKIYAGLNSLPKGPDSFGIPLGEYRNLVFGN